MAKLALAPPFNPGKPPTTAANCLSALPQAPPD